MDFKNRRFTYECDEASIMKLRSLFGKDCVLAKDFQLMISTLINKSYEKSKGKRF